MLRRLVGKGIQAGAEYREHRKDVKLARENSGAGVEQQHFDPNAEHFGAGPPPAQAPSQRVAQRPNDEPPTYRETADGDREQPVASGRAVSDDKKAALAQYEEDDDDSESDLSTDDDEADWALDEALDREDDPPEYSQQDFRPVDELVQDVLATNNASSTLPTSFERTPLPCPVIIPQRRPRKKQRGFVHAYAPLMGECSGIDQTTFIAFLQNFHKSSLASPVWTVIMVSAGIAGFAPDVIAMAVTTAVQFAAGTARELQTRHRTNDFLDKMNEELFKPAGLFAMVVKYKTTAEVIKSENSIMRRLGVGAQQVNFSTGEAVARYDRPLSSEDDSKTMRDRLKNIRLASGTTRGAVELPESAPLVFPEVDRVIVSEGPETFKDKAKDAKAFLADYMDRRAQMEYTRQDAASPLVVPEDKRKMKATLADPSHPMYNSGLVGMVSGGKMSIRNRSSSRTPTHGPDAGAYGRPSLYDSSRLYSSSSATGLQQTTLRQDKRERRALRTEQRMAAGRRVSRKKERRYDQYLQDQERMDGGDGGIGVREGRRRRGHGGPIGLVVGAAGAAIEAGRSKSPANTAPASPPQAPAGGLSPANAPYTGSSPRAPTGYFAGVDQQPGSHSRSPGPAGAQQGPGTPELNAYGRVMGRPGRKGGPLGRVKRIMQEDVLYLMIVNMPSEAELAEAREAIAAAKAAKDAK